MPVLRLQCSLKTLLQTTKTTIFSLGVSNTVVIIGHFRGKDNLVLDTTPSQLHTFCTPPGSHRQKSPDNKCTPGLKGWGGGKKKRKRKSMCKCISEQTPQPCFVCSISVRRELHGRSPSRWRWYKYSSTCRLMLRTSGSRRSSWPNLSECPGWVCCVCSIRALFTLSWVCSTCRRFCTDFTSADDEWRQVSENCCTRHTQSNTSMIRNRRCRITAYYRKLTGVEQHQIFETNKLVSVKVECLQFGDEILGPRHQAAQCRPRLGHDGRHLNLSQETFQCKSTNKHTVQIIAVKDLTCCPVTRYTQPSFP